MTKIRKVLLSILAISTTVLIFRIFFYLNTVRAIDVATPIPAPEFTSSHPAKWLNSKPLSLHELRGKVILLFIWTFD